jgi:glycosyltransferase involved in cell wall biosynthesis
LKINHLFEKIEVDFEMIFVYYYGPYNSWDELNKIKNFYPKKVQIINLSRNFCNHNTVIIGIEYASVDFIITINEDIQHNPFYIQKLIDKQTENDFDVVNGKYEELKHSFIRNIGYSLLKKKYFSWNTEYSCCIVHVD